MAAPLAQQLEELLNPRPDLRDPEDDAEEGERGSEKGSVRAGPGRGRGRLEDCRFGAARGGVKPQPPPLPPPWGMGRLGPECRPAVPRPTVPRPAALRAGSPGRTHGSARSHAALRELSVQPGSARAPLQAGSGSRRKLLEKRAQKRPSEPGGPC